MLKNDIPILEYDDTPTAVLMPIHDKLPITLPRKAVFPFLGEQADLYAQAHGWQQVATFESVTKNYPVYVGDYQGKPVCLCQAPVGAAAAVQIMDWLIGYGVREVIAGGSCGALTDLPENHFLVPQKALRDEGSSYHYLPPTRFVETHPSARKAIETVLRARDFPYIECSTWTTDGFFRETPAKVAYRRAEGCSVVEMECAALAACAQFRDTVFGELLFTADTLADTEHYQARDWGRASFELALQLCLDAVVRL